MNVMPPDTPPGGITFPVPNGVKTGSEDTRRNSVFRRPSRAEILKHVGTSRVPAIQPA